MPETPDDANASAETLIERARAVFVRQLEIVNRWPPYPDEQTVLLAAFNNAIEVYVLSWVEAVARHEERTEMDDDDCNRPDDEPPYPFNAGAHEAPWTTPVSRTPGPGRVLHTSHRSHRELCCGVLRGEPHDTTCPETGGK